MSKPLGKSWTTFSDNQRFVFIMNCLHKLISIRDEDKGASPYTNEEINSCLKSVYLLDVYATPSGFWNGGTRNAVQKGLKKFINAASSPEFKDAKIKELCAKVKFYGLFGLVGLAPQPHVKKRKRSEISEEEQSLKYWKESSQFWMKEAHYWENKYNALEKIEKGVRYVSEARIQWL